MLIKHSPEDFIVEELPAKDWDDAGTYAVFRLTKISLNTDQAIEIIARKFRIPSNIIKYAGTKDKHAHTIQYISIPSRDISNISNKSFDEGNLKLEHVGYSDEPLSLGTLKGNKFVIIVREIEGQTADVDTLIVPNYFDEQRFSSSNYDIGFNILKHDYKKAVELMCGCSDIYAPKALEYLNRHPNDYVGALKSIPKRILLMFIHAVQSFLFNEALSKILFEHALTKGIECRVVEYSMGRFIYYNDCKDYASLSLDSLELVGFNTASINHQIKALLLERGLGQRDFIIRALPDLSVEGAIRECFIDVSDLKIERMIDRAIMQFSLPKGSYATIVVKALFE
jgi:tRNA pseudouridine13 synthase